MRALVACGWFGIQAWIGGEALHTLFTSLLPGWPGLLGAGFSGHTTTEWLSFLLFWAMNVAIIYRGMNLLRVVENWAAPFVLVMTGAPAGVGGPRGERPRSAARAAREARDVRGVPARLRPVAHRDDRLLGDAVAQHAGLHPLRPQPARAGGRAGGGAAHHDVRVRGDGRPDHERERHHLRRADLGPGQAGGALRDARWSSASRCSPRWSRRSPSTSPPTSSRRRTTSRTPSRASSASRPAGSSPASSASPCSPGACSPTLRATSSAGCSATRAVSARSPAC